MESRVSCADSNLSVSHWWWNIWLWHRYPLYFIPAINTPHIRIYLKEHLCCKLIHKLISADWTYRVVICSSVDILPNFWCPDMFWERILSFLHNQTWRAVAKFMIMGLYCHSKYFTRSDWIFTYWNLCAPIQRCLHS